MSTEHDLTLMLMTLTSWPQADQRCCWKGYEFPVVWDLVDRGAIRTSRGARRAWLTPCGLDEGYELLHRYGLEDELEWIERAADRRR